MKNLEIYHNFQEMETEVLKEWLDLAFKWHDELYVNRIKKEFKSRKLDWRYV